MQEIGADTKGGSFFVVGGHLFFGLKIMKSETDSK